MNIEFDKWTTPFSVGDIDIVSLKWGEPDFWIEDNRTGKRYEVPTLISTNQNQLTIYVLDRKTSNIYEVNVEYLNAFRLLDEGGLLQIWAERDNQNINLENTFKVKNHGWKEESPLTFFHGTYNDWSFMIATSNECIEIICENEPQIIKYTKAKVIDIKSNKNKKTNK